MSDSKSLTNSYRPDVDGVRAIAVIAVVAFHAFPGSLPGGFVGVDIFFVISGYLITGILIRSIAENSFSISAFYIRRIRRIFPALSILLIAVLALGWTRMLPLDYAQLGKHILGGAFFSSNLLLWSEAGYFDADAADKPLLHLWSLGVEEQFYIVWPILLWFLSRRNRNILATLALIAAASFLLSVTLTAVAPIAAFYSPFTRTWELAAGGLIACQEFNKPPFSGFRPLYSNVHARTCLSAVGVLLMIASFFLISEDKAFPGWWALLPVAGACFVILARGENPINRYFLGWRPLIWIGLISYPLYLWHWPLLSIAKLTAAGSLSVSTRLAIVALSFLLAVATFQFVERPIRHSRISWKRTGALLATMAATAGVGSVIFLMDGVQSRFPLTLQALIRQYDYKTDAKFGTCWIVLKDPFRKYAKDCFPLQKGARPRIFLWGDSHAARLYPGLQNTYSREFDVTFMARSSCWPILHGAFGNCIISNQSILRAVEVTKPDVVVLFAHWSRYIEPPSKRTDEELFDAVDETIGRLSDAGVRRIVLLGPAPYWDDLLPRILTARLEEPPGGAQIPSRLDQHLQPFAFELDRHMKEKFVADERVEYISMIDSFCNTAGCLALAPGSDGELTTWDYGHLTTAAASYAARTLKLKAK
jgi:peptidoglycan/LPS O-acetylase OafA/YrhL